jgi:hypothetical protein
MVNVPCTGLYEIAPLVETRSPYRSVPPDAELDAFSDHDNTARSGVPITDYWLPRSRENNSTIRGRGWPRWTRDVHGAEREPMRGARGKRDKSLAATPIYAAIAVTPVERSSTRRRPALAIMIQVLYNGFTRTRGGVYRPRPRSSQALASLAAP